MELKDAIYTRRSVRAYQDKPVERADIEQLIEAAIQAPTAMNAQPWAFAVIQDPAILIELSEKTKSFLLGSIDRMPWVERYKEMLQSPDYSVFYGASAMVIICAKPGVSVTPEMDCAMAAQNLMLAARSLDLGTCWIGFAAMYLETEQGKQEFGIPQDYKVIAPVIIGHPAMEFSTMEKNPADMIFWK